MVYITKRRYQQVNLKELVSTNNVACVKCCYRFNENDFYKAFTSSSIEESGEKAITNIFWYEKVWKVIVYQAASMNCGILSKGLEGE